MKTVKTKTFKKLPIPSMEEERKLFKDLHALTPGSEWRNSLRNRIIEPHLRIAGKLATKFSNPHLAHTDIVQIGVLGLIKAAESFQFERDIRFSSYAHFIVKRTIIDGIYSQGRTIRLPVYREEQKRLLNKVSEHQEDEKIKAVVANLPYAHLTLDTPLGGVEGDITGLDLVANEEPTPEEHAAHSEHLAMLAEAVKTLPHRAASVLTLRFGLNDTKVHTLKQTAARLKLSTPTVQKLEWEALRDIRAMFESKKGKNL